MGKLTQSLAGGIRRIAKRALAVGIPAQEEIERYGADGEEAVCRLLRESFDIVIRNVVVPHKKKYLEKDFLIIHKGVPFVLEVKYWKGEIGCEGDCFYQNKDNGVHKVLKSPVGTTAQFVRCMKEYYGINRTVYGIVVFAEPDCRLSVPESMDGIALLDAKHLISHIRAVARAEQKGQEPIDEHCILRCTRFYSLNREFCKGILADNYLECFTAQGARARLDTTCLRFLSVSPQPLHLRDKLYVTYSNGASDTFYNHDAVLTVACLDGSYRKISLCKVRHVVF